ncbi:hypothetical protein JAAARDRAFT_166786 [Jaapia argillacea MUCL 33604]|uniref:Uncharacterized protein n=1 Tax=Jaapia argillacea MUCL 33604 TaxID=933084 RepID=A0A067QBQ5_9AGAM|nr:hypothetical protein JAAARDRAFT_166786 [Jaapia argillacea MUCL 33604]
MHWSKYPDPPLLRRCVSVVLVVSYFQVSRSQTISTNTEVPPLQWINLTGLLMGPSAPPLKDASIGYDEVTRSMLIFGGESQSGFPQSETYLLRLDTLTWQQPTPPYGQTRVPPARSAAIGGSDSAASYRRGHLVIGGRGSDGHGLSDVWEFDYTYQFWSQVNLSPGGPGARAGSSGGIDIRTPSTQDATSTYPNNSFYIAGGYDNTTTYPLSDLWQLDVTGTLSPNLPSSINASWHQLSLHGSLPGKVSQGSAVISQQIISVDGCTGTYGTNDSCAQGDSYVINTGSSNYISPASCPAPRFGPAVAPNLNTFSTNYATQVFLLLGTYNNSLWQDDGGLEHGEVAVLNVQTGAWARILPSGDPGTTGVPAYPSPREGAVAFSYSTALVGTTRNIASDTIIFGGRDASGNYLSDIWLLRAYNGSITQSNGTWSGFGGGNLQTGVDANGQGVTVQYMTRCAVALTTSSSSPTSSSHPGATQTGSTYYPPTQQFDTSFTHKLLAPLSIGVIFAAVLLYRVSLPSTSANQASRRHGIPFYVSIAAGLAAYGMGLVGLVFSFTSIKSLATMSKRAASPSQHLQTAHGRAGLALFIGLYGVIPILALFSVLRNSRGRRGAINSVDRAQERVRTDSDETGEKLVQTTQTEPPNSPPPSSAGPSPPASPRPRLHSWGGASLFPGLRASQMERKSSDSALESVSTTGPQKAFEVVNRPTRVRHPSGHSLAAFTSESGHYQRVPVTPRSLGDLSWLDRRRSVNVVGELDYALSQLSRPSPSTPATPVMMSSQVLVPPPESSVPRPMPEMPHGYSFCLRLLFHAFLLGLCALSLQALWARAPIATFAIFLACSIAFYVALFVLAWYGRPRESALTVVFSRLRGESYTVPTPAPTPTPTPSRPLSTLGLDQYPFPTEQRGPYVHHQPQYWTTGPDDVASSRGGPRSAITDDEDEDEDEEVRQRRIEDEMNRRDVSIVTVPKRKLWVTNPS